MIPIRNEIKDKLGNKIRDWYQHSERRIYFSIGLKDIKEVVTVLFRELKLRFVIATGQDTPQGIEILYHFSFDKTGEMFSARVILKDKKNPEIDSIANIFPGAEWIEREMWELLGINFKGHPNLKHLLLIDEWPQGDYPLRHDRET
jgi:NADH:ubiquinone oxidoreductase subunit C